MRAKMYKWKDLTIKIFLKEPPVVLQTRVQEISSITSQHHYVIM